MKIRKLTLAEYFISSSVHSSIPGAFLMAQIVKNLCNVGDQGSIPGWGRSSGEGNGYPLSVSVPGEFHGERCHSPWCPKELDTAEKIKHFHSLFKFC